MFEAGSIDPDTGVAFTLEGAARAAMRMSRGIDANAELSSKQKKDLVAFLADRKQMSILLGRIK